MAPSSNAGTATSCVTDALRAAKNSHEEVDKLKERDRMMNQLSKKLTELATMLVFAEWTATVDPTCLSFVNDTIQHVRKICDELQDALVKALQGQSPERRIDWSGTAFRKEMIEYTKDSFQLQQQRISDSDEAMDFNDERGVINQCLTVCEQADAGLQRFQQGQLALRQAGGEQTLLSGPGAVDSPDNCENQTSRENTSSESEGLPVGTLSRLQECLDGLTTGDLHWHDVWSRLRDVDMTKQFPETAGQAFNKIIRQSIGEVTVYCP
ncbi:uncharacterized protein B0I36DRAFT_396295 [Microdochium trichocladiopsis]|uniref:Fungal N-terminal domain-containing protein n=1 Tax=Microdochium trichocladiopsis TaxID=1682393 RepID=A0A9P8XSQ6_9PEZI|nr:uncharacterized protein B0I36DRAFT_396295 [Microdochium trichocladiopsis]KAH7016213.1 hypothetical protein B0I36DRAFT_396295 [Microdochium trichocladiopsis]